MRRWNFLQPRRYGFQSVSMPRYRALQAKLDTVYRDVWTSSGATFAQHAFVSPSFSGIRSMSAAKNTQKSATYRAVPTELTAESLVGVEVFRRLSAPSRGKLAALCQGRRYAAQQRVLSHKDDSRDVYFIISGKVRVTI